MDAVDNGLTAVLVDQTDGLERCLGDELAARGFGVKSVASAAECLRLVEREPVDGVVSRYVLPALDGVRLLRSLRISRPTLPFLLVPEEGSESVASEAVAAEVSGYVPESEGASTVGVRLRRSIDRERARADGEYRRRYRHLIELSPAPINVFDEEGESIWCNEATLDLLGLESRHELIGRSIFEFIHPEDRELARLELRAVTEGKESVGPTRMRLRRPDGEVRHVRISTAVGSFLGADIGQAVVVDVTSSREARTELERQRQFIDDALDALQDLFFVADADGELVRWNEAVRSVTGYDDEELEAFPLEEFFDDADTARVAESVVTVLRTGSDTVEADLVTKGGRHIPYEFRGRRLRDTTDAGTVRIAGIGRDVSDLRERERQLEVLETWLRHNIRNEVNVIRGLAEELLGGETDDVAESARRIRERAGHLLEQADRERQLVDLLTDPPEPVPVDVLGTVERVVGTCRERYPSADIEITRADDFEAVAVPSLGDAVAELVTNAIEHNDAAEPTVRIEVAVAGPDRGHVRVWDDGPGIPEAERDVLRVDREIGPLHHGSGLGLPLVYWMVRTAGGEMGFAENDPEGSTVTLTLRRAPEGRDGPS